jgi:hypothetical protein
MNTRRFLAASGIFTWIGFVAAISFMEAWLKFKAPGVNLPIGLGIGRLVFAALNKVEWLCAVVVLAALSRRLRSVWNVYLLGAVLILVLQTVWLLPALDARAEVIIQGQEPPHSYFHLVYIISECLKVICLLVRGISLRPGAAK